MNHLTYDETLAIRLEKQMRDKLRELADNLMMSESTLVRQGVLHVLHQNGMEIANRRTWNT